MVQPERRYGTFTNALIALGSNATSRRGKPPDTLRAALQALDRGPLRTIAASALYCTPFVPAGHGPDVINAVVLSETALSAGALLAHLHRLEAEFDRERQTRWGTRTLDLDLLTMNQKVVPDQTTFLHWQKMTQAEQCTTAPDQLILPHPRLQDRAFVLVPAAEVAPDWRHPVLGKTIAEMLAELPTEDVAAITRLAA